MGAYARDVLSLSHKIKKKKTTKKGIPMVGVGFLERDVIIMAFRNIKVKDHLWKVEIIFIFCFLTTVVYRTFEFLVFVK